MVPDQAGGNLIQAFEHFETGHDRYADLAQNEVGLVF